MLELLIQPLPENQKARKQQVAIDATISTGTNILTHLLYGSPSKSSSNAGMFELGVKLSAVGLLVVLNSIGASNFLNRQQM